jgi:hypothetical protein
MTRKTRVRKPKPPALEPADRRLAEVHEFIIDCYEFSEVAVLPANEDVEELVAVVASRRWNAD